MREIRWRQAWEAELTAADHEDLRVLLQEIFPRHASNGVYRDRSWASGRPDLRLVGYDGDLAVAHVAVAPRLVFAGGRPVLVGDTGLVGVRPSHRGTGLGLELLARHATAVRALELPFAFLTCSPPTASYYRRGGWQQLPPTVRTTQLAPVGLVAETADPAALVLPLAGSMADWPSGDVIRNGYEI
jgi:aminoglycoside 2'-N-acetyltransferase I